MKGHSLLGRATLTLLMVFAGAVSTSATGEDVWLDRFVAYEAKAGHVYYTRTDAGILGWNESYMLRSYLALYEVTKSRTWLDKFVLHVDYIVANTTDTDGDGFLDWKSSEYGDGGNYPYLAFDGLISLPIARFVRLVNENPGGLGAYGAQAALYRRFIETEIVPKWVTSASYPGNCWVQLNSSTGYFREPTRFDSLPGATFNPLPYNMMGPYAEMLFTMYDVNGDASYLATANAIVQYFKDGLTPWGTGFRWWYANILIPHTEDTSHGNLDIDMAIESFNRGQVMSGIDIARLSATLTDTMWNHSLSDPKVADAVDGTGMTYVYTKYLTGWVRLTQVNRISWYIAANQYRSVISPGGFNQAFVLAQILAWNPVRVLNPGFEYKSWSNPTLPALWTRIGAEDNVGLDPVNKTAGKYGVKIVSPAGRGTWQALYQKWEEWQPNTRYVVTYDAKASGSAGGRIFVYEAAQPVVDEVQEFDPSSVVGEVQDFDHSNWETRTFSFTTPASTTGELRIYVTNRDTNSTGTAYFDNVRVEAERDPAPPVIIPRQPQSQTVIAGDSVSFTVSATGFPEPAFQWQKDGVNIIGATSCTLVLNNVTATDAGRYVAVATNPSGSVSSTAAVLTVKKMAATVTLEGLSHTYDGSPKSATATTSPAGLRVGVTYDAASALPINAGDYQVVATVDDARYEGFASGTLAISKAEATVTISNLSQSHDGAPKRVTVATVPTGVAVNVTYNGTPEPPINVGDYAVVATIGDPNYRQASATGTLSVRDTTAPKFISLVASPSDLWPANHKMVAVTITADVTDAVDDAPVTRIIQVTSSDAIGGTSADVQITGDLTLNLRAERSAGVRTYTITVESRDRSGNTSVKPVAVTVGNN